MTVQVAQPKKDDDSQTMGMLGQLGGAAISSQMGKSSANGGSDPNAKPGENKHLEAAKRQLAKIEEDNKKSAEANKYRKDLQNGV